MPLKPKSFKVNQHFMLNTGKANRAVDRWGEVNIIVKVNHIHVLLKFCPTSAKMYFKHANTSG